MRSLPEPSILNISIGAPRLVDPLQEEFKRITSEKQWRRKADLICNCSDLSDEFQRSFHTYWTIAGHDIREQIDNDEMLTTLLKKTLPKYCGPDLLLFRGENLDRWNSGRVGVCWSPSLEVARMFAGGLNAIVSGGVVLKCVAHSSAILSGPSEHSRYLDEDEYTVDVSSIFDVEVIEEFPTSD